LGGSGIEDNHAMGGEGDLVCGRERADREVQARSIRDKAVEWSQG
jgi:hypothetical protein